MLATITPVAVSGGYELQLAYDAGETILDLPDVYLRTDGSGNLEFSPTSSGPYADLGANLSDGSVSSLSVAVTFAAQSDSDALAALQGLGVDPFSTLNVMGIVAPGVDLSLSAISIHVGSGTAINTRTLATGADPLTAESTGDSGDLSLDGAVISVEGALLTQVGDADITNAAGDISIIAKGNLSDLVSGFVVVPGPIPDITSTQASVDLASATVKGRDITISVESDVSDLFDDEDSPGGWGGAAAGMDRRHLGGSWCRIVVCNC